LITGHIIAIYVVCGLALNRSTRCPQDDIIVNLIGG